MRPELEQIVRFLSEVAVAQHLASQGQCIGYTARCTNRDTDIEEQAKPLTSYRRTMNGGNDD